MKTVVVLPTYNEKENISAVLDHILQHRSLHVLVVDDNSPDGTADLVQRYIKTSKRVQLLRGEKKGLGVAYRRGFEHALTQMEADILIEMDADGSHDAADIPRLLEPLKKGEADFVIGSRYVKGGSIQGWSALRHLISWSGNLVARAVAGIPSVRDCTAGFRAIRAEVALGIDWKNFSAAGYSFQIRLLHEAIRNGARVKEVPVVFRDRELGSSKLGIRDIAEFQVTAVKLGWQTYKRLAIFLTVGLLGLLINEAVFIATYSRLTDEFIVAQMLGISAGILSNFSLHETWTFRDRRKGSRAGRFSKYVTTALLGVLITFTVGHVLFSYGFFEAAIAHLIAICSATVSNVLLSFFWAWKN